MHSLPWAVRGPLVGLLLLLSVVSLLPTTAAIRTVTFSGYVWYVRSGYGNPGSNYWSDSSESVWVDDSGQLHLAIRHTNGVWYSAEVWLSARLGYGRYVFHVASRIDLLKPMVVSGLFLYQSDSHELDIEFSRWADPAGIDNVQYVVRPSDLPGHLRGFSLSLNRSHSTHSIEWTEKTIRFQSIVGNYVIQDWAYLGSSTEALHRGQETLDMNLWLYGGCPVGQSCEQEIIITAFEFIPESGDFVESS